MLGTFIYWLHRLTPWLPRKLPSTQAEYDDMKRILLEAYNVPDEPQVWALVAGHITSTPAHVMRKPWGHIANACKRLAINKLAQDNKVAAINELKAKLEELTLKESARIQQELDDGGATSITLDQKISEQIEIVEDLS